MTLFFRLILIAVSVLNFFYMARKLRKSHVEGRDTIFWMLFSALLIVLSLFPGIANALAGALGVYSPENVVFLLIIFALLIKLFFLSVKHSQLEFKVQVLAEEHAILKKKLEDALSAIRYPPSWVIAEQSDLSPGEEYQVAVRIMLDISQLPKPFQINALNNHDWRLVSDWKRFSYIP